MPKAKILNEPCETCPWRKSTRTEHWDPSCFTDMADTVFNGTGLMLCHSTGKKDRHLCAGFVIQAANDSVGLRQYLITSSGTEPSFCDEDLYATFGEMMEANGIDPTDITPRTAEACRQLGGDEHELIQQYRRVPRYMKENQSVS